MALTHSHCVHCGVGLRHWREPKTADTKVSAGGGACKGCAYSRKAERGVRTGEPRASEAELLVQRSEFEAARRARGIPASGVGFIARQRVTQ